MIERCERTDERAALYLRRGADGSTPREIEFDGAKSDASQDGFLSGHHGDVKRRHDVRRRVLHVQISPAGPTAGQVGGVAVISALGEGRRVRNSVRNVASVGIKEFVAQLFAVAEPLHREGNDGFDLTDESRFLTVVTWTNEKNGGRSDKKGF